MFGHCPEYQDKNAFAANTVRVYLLELIYSQEY